MSTRKNLLIFYIYFTQKLKTIKKQVQNNYSDSAQRIRSQIHVILEKAGIAAITTVLVYSMMMLLNMGKLVFPSQHMWVEIVSAFVFLLILFWFHRKISNFINSGRFENFQLWKKAFIEVVMLIAVTLVLHKLINFLPLRLIYPSAVFDPRSMRISETMAIVTSLFFYFLVDRERSKRRLQEKILRSTQLQKENFQAQVQSLKNQMNPHFLFNSLNVLSSLIKQDEKQASEFVYRLSKVYRSFLDHSDEQLVSLRQEMELIEAYIYLLSIRFGNNLRFKINVSKDHMDLLLPPGSLQMLVENAVKHNGSTRKKPLVVEIFSEENYLLVKNNLQPRLEKIKSTKTGLQNIRRRYKFLSEQEVTFTTTEKEFIAKLPLLKVEAYENSDY